MLTFSLVKIPIFVKITVLLTNIIFLYFSGFRRKKNAEAQQGNVNHVLNNQLIFEFNKKFLRFARLFGKSTQKAAWKV